MRHAFTAVIEKNATFHADFETEPYECAWASEARWFIHVAELEGDGASLSARVQVSPDGLAWCDEGSAFEPMSAPGHVFAAGARLRRLAAAGLRPGRRGSQGSG